VLPVPSQPRHTADSFSGTLAASLDKPKYDSTIVPSG
jgi:hypothetical protein